MAINRSSRAKDLSAKVGAVLKKLANSAQNDKNKKKAIELAKKIGNRYSLVTLPEDDVQLETNIVYVTWKEKEDGEWAVEYLFLNTLGSEDVQDATEYRGLITAKRIPGLPIDPSNDNVAEQLRPYFIDILQVLSDENKIKFKVNDVPAEKNRDEFLKDFLEARDAAVRSVNLEKEEILFQLYYGLMRVKFCLDQFDMLRQPEQLMPNVQSSLKDSETLQKKLEDLHVVELQSEYKEFNSVFTGFTDYMQNGSSHVLKTTKFGKELDEATVAMQAAVAVLHQARQEFKKLSQAAHSEADSGAEAALESTLRAVNKQKNVIERAKNDVTKKLTTYIESFQAAIGDVQQKLSSTEEQPSKFNQKIADMHTLHAYAHYYIDLVESARSQSYKPSFEVLDTFEAIGELLRLDQNIDKEGKIPQLLNEVATYVGEYQASRELVADACDARVKLQNSVKASIKTCDELAGKLAKDKQALDLAAATVAAKDLQPYENLLNLKPNGPMALFRRHWWKMLIGAAVLTVVMAVVAVFAWHLVVGAIFVALAGAAVGGALGFGVGKITDKFCPMELSDDNDNDAIPMDDVVVNRDSPSDSPASSRPQSPRASTASITLTTSESHGDALARLTAEGGKLSSILVEDLDGVSPQSPAKEKQEPLRQYNPFDRDEGNLRLHPGMPKKSTNPFDGLPGSVPRSSSKPEEKPKHDFNDDYANPFAAGFKG